MFAPAGGIVFLNQIARRALKFWDARANREDGDQFLCCILIPFIWKIRTIFSSLSLLPALCSIVSLGYHNAEFFAVELLSV